jgi:hypothetical protein
MISFIGVEKNLMYERSVMDIIKFVKDTAKKIIESEKRLQPMAFFCHNNEIQQITPIASLQATFPNLFNKFKTGENIKEASMIIIGALCKILECDSVIIVNDAAMKQMSKDEIGDPTSHPLTYPKSMRKECIVICCVKFPSKESNVTVVPYKGGDGKDVEFIDEEMVLSGKEFDSHIIDTLLVGYEKFPVEGLKGV